MSTAAKVAQAKRKSPEKFCSNPRCLWRTGGGDCPRHKQPAYTCSVLRCQSLATCHLYSATRFDTVGNYFCDKHADEACDAGTHAFMGLEDRDVSASD